MKVKYFLFFMTSPLFAQGLLIESGKVSWLSITRFTFPTKCGDVNMCAGEVADEGLGEGNSIKLICDALPNGDCPSAQACSKKGARGWVPNNFHELVKSKVHQRLGTGLLTTDEEEKKH